MIHKSHIIILVLALCFSIALTMKRSEAGSNDWHMKNIGAISHLYPAKNNRLFFLSQLGIFGHLSKETGSIENRIALNPGEKIIDINLKQLIISTPQNQVLVYRIDNLDKHVENRLIDQSKKFGQIISYLKRDDGILYIAGKHEVRMHPDSSEARQVILEAKQDERFLGLREIKGDIGNHIVLIIAGKDTICSKQISGKTVLQKSTKSICFDAKIDGQIEHLLVSNDYIFVQWFDHSGNQKSIDYSFAQKKAFEHNLKYINNYGSFIYSETGSYNLKTHENTNHRIIEDSHGSEVRVEQILEDEGRINLFRNEYKLNSISNAKGKIRHLWINFRHQIDYDVLIQFDDLKMSFYQFNKGVAKSLWSRQQSLAYIDKLVFMKVQTQNRLNNEYHRKMLSTEYKNKPLAEKIMDVPFVYLNRLTSQLTDLKQAFFDRLAEIQSFFGNQSGFDFRKIMKFTMSEEQQKRYGLRKNIIIVTKKNTIISIDSKNSQVVWKRNVNSQQKPLISLIKMKRDYEAEVAVAISYSKKSKTIEIDEIQINGKIRNLKRIKSQNEPSIHKINEHSILLKDGERLETFSMNESPSSQSLAKTYYFYSIEKNSINGWAQQKGEIIKLWNLELSPNQTIVASASSFRGQNSRIPLVDQQKVIFKNIDFTNLAVLTRLHSHLYVYAINGKTGHIQFNQYQSGVSFDHPINLVYDENNILVTYFNIRNRLFEVWTIEQYQDRVETSALNIIKDYYDGFNFAPVHNRNNVIFLSEVFGSTIPIKQFFISESKLSLIRRNMIVVSQNNQLYTITRELISARRPKQTAIFSNEKYPAYEYLLPFIPSNYFSHANQLSEISNIRFSSTDLESTIFVFAYGVDAFLIRMAPDKPFDMITEDFNYVFLIAIVIVVTGIVYYLKQMILKAKLTKSHRD